MRYKILLTNLGSLHNIGFVMVIKAIVENFDADFYYHKFTVCKGYEALGLKGTWKIWGFDIVLSIGTDTFTTYYGVLNFLKHVIRIAPFIMFHQPFAMFADTFSEFGRFSRAMMLIVMRKAKFITVRELRSLWLCESMGINAVLTSDVAWLLKDWKSNNYFGGAYHKIIGAIVAGKSGRWNDTSTNFKFDIFKETINIEEMRKNARKNFELLYSVLQHS